MVIIGKSGKVRKDTINIINIHFHVLHHYQPNFHNTFSVAFLELGDLLYVQVYKCSMHRILL